MKMDLSFIRQMLGVLAGITAIGWYPVQAYTSEGTMAACLAGAALATTNAIAGYATIEYSMGKPANAFLVYVLGGMGVRMLFTASALVVLIWLVRMPAAALVSSLGVYYIAYLVLEIFLIQKRAGISTGARGASGSTKSR